MDKRWVASIGIACAAVAAASAGAWLLFSQAAGTADLNSDGKVDVTDLSIILSNYGKQTATGDINGDGSVTIIDLSILLTAFGKPVTTPQPPQAPLFAAEFNGGTLAPFVPQHCPPTTALTVVGSPARTGAGSMRASVGGSCGGWMISRAEVLSDNTPAWGIPNNTERYFGWSQYFPDNFPVHPDTSHCVNMQIKSYPSEGGANIGMNCRGPVSVTPELTLGGYSTPCGWRQPLVKGGWHDFVLRAYVANTGGNIDLWYRAPGQAAYSKQVSGCALNILKSPTDTAYWKLGYYRAETMPGSASVYFDTARIGTTYASVALP